MEVMYFITLDQKVDKGSVGALVEIMLDPGEENAPYRLALNELLSLNPQMVIPDDNETN